MNENIKSLINKVETDVSGKWINISQLEKYSQDVILECLNQIEIANSKHCAYTSFDLGTVECAKEKIMSHITEHFDIKITHGVF
jgi:hypothetical protein